MKNNGTKQVNVLSYALSNDGTYYIVTGGVGLAGDIQIPDEWNGKPVKEIAAKAFQGCSGLTSVIIGNNVESIGDSAFSDCRELSSITIPNSVTKIGTSAFAYCYGLKKVHITDLAAWCKIDFGSCDANPLYYTQYLYLNGKKVTNLTIPQVITKINAYAFYNSKLTSITIPNGVTSIGEDAFYNCDELTEVHITNLAAWCKIDFGNCDANPLCYAHHLYLNGNKVTSLTIPQGITKINACAFCGCYELAGVTLPAGVTFGNSAVSGCSGLAGVIIGKYPPINFNGKTLTAFQTQNRFNVFMKGWNRGPTHRFRSYDYCKDLFNKYYAKPSLTCCEKDYFALNLFCYLTSWGMLRGSSWFLQKSYKFLLPAVDVLFDKRYQPLLTNPLVSYNINLVLKLYDALERALNPGNGSTPSLVLICKIMMGTYGCVIAYDDYDIKALKQDFGITVNGNSRLTKQLLQNTYSIICNNQGFFKKLLQELDTIYGIKKIYGINFYTVFKVLDMILWEYGGFLQKNQHRGGATGGSAAGGGTAGGGTAGGGATDDD